MVSNIKISIITATRNCAQTLPDCFASVARQSHRNYEHIVVDGASSDSTCSVIRSHLNQISIFKSEPDQGIYDALNKGISLSTGEVIGFLHSDDFYASDDVLMKIATAFNDSSVCAVYGDLEYVSSKNVSTVIRRWRSCNFSKSALDYGWMPAHPTLYVRREWYEKIGGFDIGYRISSDYLSILKLFSFNDFKPSYIPNVLVKMRYGGASNKSVSAVLNKSKEDWRALRSCNFSIPRTIKALFFKNFRKISQFF